MWLVFYFLCFFFFKQKTAYDMRISDWSSDVCSSDLDPGPGLAPVAQPVGVAVVRHHHVEAAVGLGIQLGQRLGGGPGVGVVEGLEQQLAAAALDRKRVGSGKSVSVRVALCGIQIIIKRTYVEFTVHCS